MHLEVKYSANRQLRNVNIKCCVYDVVLELGKLRIKSSS